MQYFYLYILKCSDGSYYVGHTDDIDKRISEHYTGEIDCYTKKKRPFQVVLVDYFASRYEALSAERKIKKWSRVKKEAYIKKDWELLSLLGKRKKKKIIK